MMLSQKAINKVQENLAYIESTYTDFTIGDKPDAAFIAQYRSVLPETLFYIWDKIGFAAFEQGSYHFVNPMDYADILAQCLAGTDLAAVDDFLVVGRNAFGKLAVMGTHTESTLTIDMDYLRIFPSIDRREKDDFITAIEFFTQLNSFNSSRKNNASFIKQLAYCQQQFGPLQSHEVYGLAPHPALGGGEPTIKHRFKTDVIPYLSMVSQLDQFEVMMDIVQYAKSMGVMPE
ncbi:GAD-like domain-containing protein [Oligella urethralis]|uniref:DUF1851 domain-containing protein n=1 Tax=Oligella urethralis DNF00040 TaxID=1401065 RepID=A0A096AWX8_9BURK|nr:GAD-like domain-containing protein [Oligella urethralis]KGF25529.1 hypothetical protein HMPREF2130_11120 [Oligella urethralis DNF00040]WOS38792.1 hypothetical protein RP300_02373 [Oligella urethralis]